MMRPMDMMDAVRLGNVPAASLYLQRDCGREHKSGLLYMNKSGLLYICEAVRSKDCSTTMLDLLLLHGSEFFEVDVSGKCAVEYAMELGKFDVLSFMHRKCPDFANAECEFNGRYITVTEGAVKYRNPELLLFFHKIGGKLDGRALDRILISMWNVIHLIDETRALRIVRESAKCIAVCVLMGVKFSSNFPCTGFDEFEEDDWYLDIPNDTVAFFRHGMRGGIDQKLNPKLFTYHQELCALLPHLSDDLHSLSQRPHADVWHYAFDTPFLLAWIAQRRQIARSCYAALYFGDGETPTGRAPLRALGDADTVRELLTLFLVPKRRH